MSLSHAPICRVWRNARLWRIGAQYSVNNGIYMSTIFFCILYLTLILWNLNALSYDRGFYILNITDLFACWARESPSCRIQQMRLKCDRMRALYIKGIYPLIDSQMSYKRHLKSYNIQKNSKEKIRSDEIISSLWWFTAVWGDIHYTIISTASVCTLYY